MVKNRTMSHRFICATDKKHKQSNNNRDLCREATFHSIFISLIIDKYQMEMVG